MNRTVLGLALTLASIVALRAEEGMWTFDNLPVARLKERYGFVPDQAWLDHVRLSVVRFPDGTGSFVSGDGLVLTNHHVGHEWIEQVSGPGRDYIKHGFVAAGRSQEIRVPGLELATLVAMEDVSAAVAKAVPPGAGPAEAAKARREALARLVQAAEARTGLACEPVVLYQGGESWIYTYKVHKDVRLVMAPEYDIAAFGKDWDNFSFPRHDLDFSLFRVYEDGVPYHPPHHLAWGQGPRLGDLTLVPGHPGRTSRQETVAQMEAYRDALNPATIRLLERQRAVLRGFAAAGGENARQVTGALMGVENAYKVYVNEVIGLQDRAAMAAVARAEADLRAAVAKDPELQALAGRSWDRIAEASARRAASAGETLALSGRGLGPLSLVQALARIEAETAKPEKDRDLAFRTDKDVTRHLERLRGQEGFGAEVSAALLKSALEGILADLGPAHPASAAILQGREPKAALAALMGSRLVAPGPRADLVAGGLQAVRACQDPLMDLGRRLEALAAPLRKRAEEDRAQVQEHGARIAQARFKVYGRSVYPDATFTLRLSYGAVATYPANGTLIQPFTTFGGLYDRADAWGADAEEHSWQLPQRWLERRGRLNPSQHFNFITTNDIIGGNSGSPMVGREGQVVGLAFDGNIESNAGAFYFDPRVNRCVAVDAGAILAALEKVYDAAHLVKELTTK